jgi:putative transcriptional regulator
MKITHHPDVATLMSCAAGSQPEAFAAVVASHLSMCPACRAEVARMQEIGAALFDKLTPAAMNGPCPVARLRAAEADGTADAEAMSLGSAAGVDVPAPLVPLVGTRLDGVPWRRLAPGIQHHPIALSTGCCGDLRLIKVAAGKALPEHGHVGEELTLILRGSYEDRLGIYRAGDVADLDEDVEHRPTACPEQGCICLMATEGKLRFKGLLARLLQPLLGL